MEISEEEREAALDHGGLLYEQAQRSPPGWSSPDTTQRPVRAGNSSHGIQIPTHPLGPPGELVQLCTFILVLRGLDQGQSLAWQGPQALDFLCLWQVLMSEGCGRMRYAREEASTRREVRSQIHSGHG